MAGSVIIAPHSVSLRTASGLLSYGPYTGAGGNAAPDDMGIQVAASLSSNAVAQLRFAMPDTIPTGTLNLRCVMLTSDATTSHVGKLTISSAAVSSGASPSAATLQAQAQTTIPSSTPATMTDFYQVVNVPLTLTSPTADQFVVVAVTFNNTGWTISSIANFQFFLVWL